MHAARHDALRGAAAARNCDAAELIVYSAEQQGLLDVVHAHHRGEGVRAGEARIFGGREAQGLFGLRLLCSGGARLCASTLPSAVWCKGPERAPESVSV